jgi:hypothetical protein
MIVHDQEGRFRRAALGTDEDTHVKVL